MKNFYLPIMVLSYLFIILPVLVNVAFITLLERKILGYSQLRKGPSKVGWGGVVQPFNDAIKLFTKESNHPAASNSLMYYLGPVAGIFLSLSIWLTIPNYGSIGQSLSVIIVYMIMSMNVYPLMISGWSSNSNYAIIGSMRGVAQSISYEISFALIIMGLMFYCATLSVFSVLDLSLLTSKVLFNPLMAGLWLISCVAETNRTPFDFAEGESELVSGFNIEYGSGGFALIFMAEYASIYFLSLLFWLLFMTKQMSGFNLPAGATMLVFFWVWLRTTLPRYRYDMLMSLSWFSILPCSLFALITALLASYI